MHYLFIYFIVVFDVLARAKSPGRVTTPPVEEKKYHKTYNYRREQSTHKTNLVDVCFCLIDVNVVEQQKLIESSVDCCVTCC
jgi:hypothetical protein